jgi:prepilin-type N-terminal cleavage/methylation domain-containing protein/prepilin-type processing-associated H-X9-DG protein
MPTAADSSMARKFENNILGHRASGGFTLIELLVVIAIIGLLLAIMLPAVTKVRALGQRLVCKHNLKQIAFAWHMYLEDHEGRFYQDTNANRIYGGWKGIYYPTATRPLNKYVSLPEIPQSEAEAKIFRCPADSGSTGLPAYSSVGTSYQTNMLLIGQNAIGPLISTNLTTGINNKLPGLKRTGVANEAQLLLIGDFPWGNQWMPPPYSRGPYWHRRCCYFNLAFLDGHVDHTKIRKGLIVTGEYVVLPFKSLYEDAIQDQVEFPCPLCD